MVRKPAKQPKKTAKPKTEKTTKAPVLAPLLVTIPPPPVTKTLNLRIDTALDREFKIYAVTNGYKLNELFRLCFDSFRKQEKRR